MRIYARRRLSLCLSPAPPTLLSLAPSATRESPGFINVRHYRFSRGIAFLFLSLPSRYRRSIIAARKYRSATAVVVFSTSVRPVPSPRYASLSRDLLPFPLSSWSTSTPFRFPPASPLQPFHLTLYADRMEFRGISNYATRSPFRLFLLVVGPSIASLYRPVC